MSVEGLVTPLLRAPMFARLSPLHLAKIARITERIVYRPGEQIVRNGDGADAAILLVAGEAIRTDRPGGSSHEVGEPIAPGTLLAEMAMLIETEHSSSVVAHSQVRALRVPRVALNELIAHEPALADHFLDTLTARLRAIAEELRQIDESLGAVAPCDGPQTESAQPRGEGVGRQSAYALGIGRESDAAGGAFG